MKPCLSFKISICIFISAFLLLSFLTSCNEKKNRNNISFSVIDEGENKENKQNEPKKEETEKPAKFDKSKAKLIAKEYLNFAKIPYCGEYEECKICKEIQEKGYSYKSSQNAEIEGQSINFVVYRNKEKQETVVSFSGPKSDNMKFIHKIYMKGFSFEGSEIMNTPIEAVFLEAYTAIKAKMLKVLTEILHENEDEKIILVGHSFGGSLAILTAYDLKKSNVLTKVNSPKLITFGALKMGNATFMKSLQRIIPVGIIRLRSELDLFYYIPRCVFNYDLNVFHCYTSYVNLIKIWPVYAHYLYYYSPVIRTKLILGAPQILKTQGLSLKPAKGFNVLPNISPYTQSLKSKKYGINNNKHLNNLKSSSKTNPTKNKNSPANGNKSNPLLNSYRNFIKQNNMSSTLNQKSLKANNFVKKLQHKGLFGHHNTHSNSAKAHSRREFNSNVAKNMSLQIQKRKNSFNFNKKKLRKIVNNYFF